MRVHAIIFGGIGTLVETSELQRECFNRAFDEAGIDWHWDRRSYRRLLAVAGGQNRIRYFAQSTDRANPLDEATIVALHARKAAHFIEALNERRIDARAGVRRLINKARNSDVTLAIASTTSEENIIALAKAGGLDIDAFDVVLHAGSVTHRKPHPQVYQRCMQFLAVAAQHAVAIEDSDSGMRSALAAGIKCIAMPGENTSAQNFDEAALVLQTLGDVDGLKTAEKEQQFSPRFTGLDLSSFKQLVAAIR
jgi:HAD superfamily hydrolase (TIGR01509 family)